MIRKILPIVIFSVSALLAQAQNELKVGALAPDIVYKKSYPETYSIPSGKPIFLDFWATWCGPCVAGLIESNHLVDKYKDRIEFVAITDTTSRKIPEFIKSRKFNYTFLVDRDTTTFSSFGVSGIPHAFLIDADRTIQWAGHSRSMDEAMLIEFLETGKVKPRKVINAFNVSRFDNSPVSSSIYRLVIVDKNLLDKHKTILIGHTDDAKGNYSNAPEWTGRLTLINYDLAMFTKRTQKYFKNKQLSCDVTELSGFDFIAVPFEDFDGMNTYLTKNYGLSFKRAD